MEKLPTNHSKVEAAVVVIFGASRDLTQRKLVPALHSLACEGYLPQESSVIGVARSELSDTKFQDHIYHGVQEYARLNPVVYERRPGYYDKAGVLRDMVQNHLLQLLTLTAMEPPSIFSADALRDEKVKVLRAMRPGRHNVWAQYNGYTDEEGVAEDSTTPTYAALQYYIDNWRWQGVPVYLRSGKKLALKTSEIASQFKPVPHLMFPANEKSSLTPNGLSLCIQPDEGIHLRFEIKQPGSWGPKEAEQMLAADRRQWYQDCGLHEAQREGD